MYKSSHFVQLCIGGPRFDKSSENFRVTLNDRVEFPCNPSSEPHIMNPSWRKDGNVLTEDGLQFIIEEAQYDDEGVYTCEVNNNYSTDSKSFHLKVRSKILFVIKCLFLLIHTFFIMLFRPTHAIVASNWHNPRTFPGGCHYSSTRVV